MWLKLHPQRHPSNLSAATAQRTTVEKHTLNAPPSGHVISVATGFYFISIHLSTTQQKCNTLQLPFSHFITACGELLQCYVFARLHAMSTFGRICIALYCWHEGNCRFHVYGIQKQPFWNGSQTHTQNWRWSAVWGNMLFLLGWQGSVFLARSVKVLFLFCFSPSTSFWRESHNWFIMCACTPHANNGMAQILHCFHVACECMKFCMHVQLKHYVNADSQPNAIPHHWQWCSCNKVARTASNVGVRERQSEGLGEKREIFFPFPLCRPPGGL